MLDIDLVILIPREGNVSFNLLGIGPGGKVFFKVEISSLIPAAKEDNQGTNGGTL